MRIDSIPYTLCFCISGDSVLMLFRSNPPNRSLWNGIGGKITEGESVLGSLYREVLEEAEIDLEKADVKYSGVVCWNTSDGLIKGMYCFLAYLPISYYFVEDRQTREGTLSWRELDWVVDRNNMDVVDNISQFLPMMLSEKEPALYSCSYNRNSLQKLVKIPLPQEYLILE